MKNQLGAEDSELTSEGGSSTGKNKFGLKHHD